jgi:hypothetical protein
MKINLGDGINMTPEQKAAFINAQTAMMLAEREIMIAENIEREKQGFSEANGPQQWQRFHDEWEPILGYNALITFFRD